MVTRGDGYVSQAEMSFGDTRVPVEELELAARAVRRLLGPDAGDVLAMLGLDELGGNGPASPAGSHSAEV